jgi:hypothetical protein
MRRRRSSAAARPPPLCGRPEAAGAAPPAPRSLHLDCHLLRRRRPRSNRHLHLHHLQLPLPPSPSSSADGSSRGSPRPARTVRPPAAPVHALCRPAPRQLRRWRRRPRTFCQLTQTAAMPSCAVHLCMPLLLSSGRLWLWFRASLLEAGVANEKPQKREWPFAGVSGCAARPVVKHTWHDVSCVHSVAARKSASRAHSCAAVCVQRRRLYVAF